LTGCSEEKDFCPYNATSEATCSSAAERAVGATGLCQGRSVYDMTRECMEWDPGFRGCWIACIEAAASCEDVYQCSEYPEDGGCYCCGREDDDYPGC
jgi:hypothetical protein